MSSKLSEGSTVIKSGEEKLISTEEEVGVDAGRFDSIVSAIDYADNENIGKVLIPAGTFTGEELGPNDEVRVDDGTSVTIEGTGPGQTILDAGEDNYGLRFSGAGECHVRGITMRGGEHGTRTNVPVTIENCVIDGLGETSPSVVRWTSSGASGSELRNVEIKGVQFDAIDLEGADNVKLHNITIRDVGRYGLRFFDGDDSIASMVDIYADGATDDAIEFRDTASGNVVSSGIVRGSIGGDNIEENTVGDAVDERT